MTGCGCLILVALLIGGIFFMVFGSTDPGEPIAQATALGLAVLLARMTLVPVGRRLIRARRA